MNRDQKAAAIAEIVAHIDSSQAVFAVDYKGISVPQAAELRAKLRDADATFKVVKNSLTERAADEAGAEQLKELLEGPTALTFVRGDIAVAAKAIADYGRSTQLLPFKGGLMEGAPLDSDQIRALSRLPSREVLYGQLVGVVASPVSGLVRTLSALVSGLAVALGQVREKKESGEIPAGEPPAAEAPPAAEEAPPAAEETPAEDAPAAAEEASTDGAEASAGEAAAASAEATDTPAGEDVPAAEEPPGAEEPSAAEEAPAEESKAESAEPAQDENDNEAGASAQQPDAAEANPTKED